jgi:hypothetical protein
VVCSVCRENPATYSVERVGSRLGKVAPLNLCDACFVRLLPQALQVARRRLRDQARRERIAAEKDEEGAARDLSA